jgi:hypothetical protein
MPLGAVSGFLFATTHLTAISADKGSSHGNP